jgi:hypothetical protein
VRVLISTGGPTDLYSLSTSWPSRSIESNSYHSWDYLLPADNPILCLECEKSKDDSPDDISTLLSRSPRLNIFGFMGFGVLTLGVLILLRSGFTWSGIWSKFTHGGQSRSTKMLDYTSNIRLNVNRFTRAAGQFLRTRIPRAIFLFRMSCVPLILVWHYLHLTLQSMVQNLMFGRWPFLNST